MNDRLDQVIARFLSWRLPEDFAPDGGISFDRHLRAEMPVGTNLFSFTQAKAMFEHALSTTAVSLSRKDATVDPIAVGYLELKIVLDLAFDQSARGKGKARHNPDNKPFLDQPIMEIGRMVGVGYQTGQIMKKVQEATTMNKNGNREGAKAELLGAIVYAAAAYLLVEERGKSE